jgi:hypothetical protein
MGLMVRAGGAIAMDDSGPSWTDPCWVQNPAFAEPTIPHVPSAGEPGPKQPPFDPAEPWTDLPLPDGTAIGGILGLADELRESGIPIRSDNVRRSGFFAKGKANVTLSVPVRKLADAKRLVARYLANR